MFKKEKYTDNELIELVRKGESNKALLFLYKTIQPKVSTWISQNNGSIEEAQDIFQDCVIVFYKYVINSKFKEEESIEGFIYSVAKNKWINKAKQNKRFVNDEIKVETYKTEEETLESEDLNEVIKNLLEQLGEVCKELLTYSIFYKLSMEDIALRMEYDNANTAKTKNYKCKQRLVKLVKNKAELRNRLYSE